LLDGTKVPRDLVVHRVWAPEGAAGAGVRPVAYVTERRRRLVGGLLAGVGFVVLVVLFLVQAPSVLAILGLAISVAGGWYALGGESGFYEVKEDGSLGEFLGRSKPDLGSMRRVKVP
jgi:hypothetical protein